MACVEFRCVRKKEKMPRVLSREEKEGRGEPNGKASQSSDYWSQDTKRWFTPTAITNKGVWVLFRRTLKAEKVA